MLVARTAPHEHDDRPSTVFFGGQHNTPSQINVLIAFRHIDTITFTPQLIDKRAEESYHIASYISHTMSGFDAQLCETFTAPTNSEFATNVAMIQNRLYHSNENPTLLALLSLQHGSCCHQVLGQE